jgi:hypothetical protein
MRVLLDEQLPLDLTVELRGHVVDTVVSRGWAGITNGELLGRMRGQYAVLEPGEVTAGGTSGRLVRPRDVSDNRVRRASATGLYTLVT